MAQSTNEGIIMIFIKSNQWLVNAIINGAKCKNELPIDIDAAEKCLNIVNVGELLISAKNNTKIKDIELPALYFVNKKYYFLLGEFMDFKDRLLQ